MEVTIRQISVASEPGRTFFLKLEWAQDLGAGFVVLLCDGTSAWSGEVSEEDVSREAQDLEMQRDRYVEELQLALAGGSPAARDYSFRLATERVRGAGLQLVYEKVQSDISLRLGVVELQPVPEALAVVAELVAYGLKRSADLQAQNQHLQEQNQLLKTEQDRVTAQMSRYVRGKETLERDLYSRFVLILNEKKAKIRALQETIKQLQDSIEKDKKRSRAGACGSKAPEEGGAEEASDYGGTTDEEEGGDPEPPAPPPTAREMPSSSPMDEGLSDLTDVAPCRKRRLRHMQQLEVQAKRVSGDQQHKPRQEPKEAKESSKAPARATPVPAIPDPDDLFDDI